MIFNRFIWICSVTSGFILFGCDDSSDSNTVASQLFENSELNPELNENDSTDSSLVTPLIVDTNLMEVTMLPRPNSGKHSFAEAENEKSEIYNLCPTFKYWEWKNPTTGGSVHINQQDELIVYNATFPNLDSTDIFMPDSVDLREYVGGIGFGNPASVLVTSEINPKNSNAMSKILEDLFEPGTQLYYLKK